MISTKHCGCILILQSPSILVTYLDNFFCFCGNGMITSMLEPHLKAKVGASQGDVGLTFLISGAVYMISSPIGGLVSFFIPLFTSKLFGWKE